MQVGQQILLQKFLFKISQISIQGDKISSMQTDRRDKIR